MSKTRKEAVLDSASSTTREASCGKCDKELCSDQSIIVCATCTQRFHIQCQKLSKGKFKVLQEDDGVLWFCQACRRTTRNMISKMSEMEKRLVNLEDKMKTSINEVNVLQKQSQSLQIKNTELEKEVKETKENIKDVMKQHK